MANINEKIIYRREHYDKARDIVIGVTLFSGWVSNIILIGGASGVGKTEIANILSRVFWNSKVISLDKYYLTPERYRTKERKKNMSIIGVNEIDWELVREIIEDSKRDVLIVEGLYANYLTCKNSFSVFLEGTWQQTEEFRRERKKEKQSKWRNEVLKREQKAVNKFKKHADLII